ncbi:MAG TPA: PEP-CTERM sorting domain-containing protein [Phycisphaerales bacterium]|nr:PEP-CTERM sorting domain-containing protein [Phycisphaerales bacterium]
MRLSNAIGTGLALVVGSAAAAQYQWQAVPLHPPGAYQSEARAASGARQGGVVTLPGLGERAVIWEGSADNWTDLTPTRAVLGLINGMDASSQVGQVSPTYGTFHAALWRGTAESAVNLHPGVGYHGSDALAVVGDMQVGRAKHSQTGRQHAALWRGTAASFVDLHPAGAEQSHALATDGVLQGGWATLPGGAVAEAVIWAGSAESVVDLTPPGVFEAKVFGMAPGVQVGLVRHAGENPRAALWRGSKESFVDFSPPGSIASDMYDTTGTVHAGSASFGGLVQAGVWLSDDPASFVNLHALLPPQFFGSSATGVYQDGDTLYVTGFATRGPSEAWLWIGTIPAPGTAWALLVGVGITSNRRRRR